MLDWLLSINQKDDGESESREKGIAQVDKSGRESANFLYHGREKKHGAKLDNDKAPINKLV